MELDWIGTGTVINGRRLKRKYERQFGEVGRRYGLTAAEVQVLLFLGRYPNADTARDITESRDYTKSHVSKAVDSLMKKGFLTGVQDDADRRVVRLKLLPPAAAPVQEAIACQDRFVGRLFEGFTAQENAEFERLTKKILRNLADL